MAVKNLIFNLMFLITLLISVSANAYRPVVEKTWIEKITSVFEPEQCEKAYQDSMSGDSRYFSTKFQGVENFLVFLDIHNEESLPEGYTVERIKNEIIQTIDGKFAHCEMPYKIKFMADKSSPLVEKSNNLSIYIWMDYSKRFNTLTSRVLNYRKGYHSFKDLATRGNRAERRVFDMSEDPDLKMKNLYGRIGYVQ